MNLKTNSKAQGVAATCTLHLLLLILLLWVVMTKPLPQEEGGLQLLVGNTPASSGQQYNYTEVQAPPQPLPQQPAAPQQPQSPPPQPVEEPVVTQDDEESVAMPDAEAEARKREQAEAERIEKERIEAERREQERLAEAERQRKAEEERRAREANEKIAGAFGKGRELSQSGSTDTPAGAEGSPQGTSTEGTPAAQGGVKGAWDLTGRSLGRDGLPSPHYTVQEEGRVVITITVDPSGKVISAQKNARTNTTSLALINAAREAALKARFNSVNTVENQMGTITYYFKLK